MCDKHDARGPSERKIMHEKYNTRSNPQLSTEGIMAPVQPKREDLNKTPEVKTTTHGWLQYDGEGL